MERRRLGAAFFVHGLAFRGAKENNYSAMAVLAKVIDTDKDIKQRCRELAKENMFA